MLVVVLVLVGGGIVIVVVAINLCMARILGKNHRKLDFVIKSRVREREREGE